MRFLATYGAMLFLLTPFVFAQHPAPPGPDPVKACLERAARETRASNLDEAAGALQQALKLAPDSVDVHERLAQTYIKMGESRNAIREREEIARLAPGDYANAMALGFLYFEDRREDRAQELFELAAASPDAETRKTARETLARVRADYDAQIKRWERAIDVDPRAVQTRIELAELYRKNRQYGRAIEQYQAVLRIEPDLDRLWLNVAELEKLRGQPAAARACYERVLHSPEPRISELARAGLATLAQ